MVHEKKIGTAKIQTIIQSEFAKKLKELNLFLFGEKKTAFL